MTLIRPVLIVAFTAATIACNKTDSDRASQTTTTKATTTPNTGSVQTTTTARYEVATARIAGARCDREVSCVQTGSNKRFESRDICARDESRRTQDELKSSDCPNGIDDAKLQTCIAALAKQDCSALISSLQNIDVCKTSSLCITK